MNSLPPIPCANMVEHDPPGCGIGRKFPEDCHSECPKYEPGINQAERTRCEVWSVVWMGESNG